MSYVLGVDGGNTKTIALLAQLDGTIVGSGRGGCGDIYAAGSPHYGSGCADVALSAVDDAIEAAFAHVGARPHDLLSGAFSMAGADWPEDYAYIHAAVSERGLGRTVTVVNDAIGALRAGSPDGAGVAVACGTGIGTGARGPDGRTWHTSSWQEANGAHEFGRRTLRVVYRAELGLDPATSLTRRVLDLFGQRSVEEVLHLLTARGRHHQPVGVDRLAPILLDEAANGDPVARRIVEEQGAVLGDYALAAARRVGIEGTPFPLVLTGGVFRHPAPELAEAVIRRVRSASPAVRPIRSRFEPVVGALIIALETAGLPVGDDVLDRVAATMPPSSLFAT